MRRLRSAVVILVLVLLGGPLLAGEARVRVADGRISASFEDVPATEALQAVRQATGIEIVVPPSAQTKIVTLKVEHSALEPFIRRLLHALDLGGYALVYDPSGGVGRLIVVDRSQGAAPLPEQVPAASPPAGSPDEPVYIPPSEPPVYIPPREPPVYIPPREPPVYIPPAKPPEYVPPASEPRYVHPAQ